MPVVRRAKVYSCGDDGVDLKVTTERSLSPQDLGAVILGCTTASYNEFLTNKHFGLPPTQIKYVERIEEGLPIFVFNFSEREMHGIFEAVNGTVNVDPSVWGTSSSTHRPTFPARVCVRPRQGFPIVSLPESIFKDSIIDNYYSYTRFYFELDLKQAEELVDLFMSQTIVPLRHISKREELDRSSAPDTDVHVVYREALISASENIVCGKYYVHELYGTCALQSMNTVLEKLGAQKLYDSDSYSTSLNSEPCSIDHAGDKYDPNLFRSPQCDYIPAQEDAITFRENFAGKDMTEAGTFSFHNPSFQIFLANSERNGDTPEGAVEDLSTNNAAVDLEKIVDVAKSVPCSPVEIKERMQQPDEKVDPESCSHRPGLQEGNILQLAAVGTTSFLPKHDEEDEQQSGGRAESVSLHVAQDECANLIGEKCFFLGLKDEEDVSQLGDIAPGCTCEGHEEGERCTHLLLANGGVQETSIARKRGSVAYDEVTTPVNAPIRIREDKDLAVGSVPSQAPGSESERGMRAQSKSNYGAMFSWASEVTRFLSWRGHASRNVEQKECRQFLGKLRRLNIMRDESQAQALVHQIQALRNPAKEEEEEAEETLDFEESYDPVNEQLLDQSIDGSERSGREPSVQDQSITMEEQEEPDEQLAEQDSMSAEHLGHGSSSPEEKSQEEVRLWRSEWLKEAKWRLEDYEDMQNTMSLLEKRFT